MSLQIFAQKGGQALGTKKFSSALVLLKEKVNGANGRQLPGKSRDVKSCEAEAKQVSTETPNTCRFRAVLLSMFAHFARFLLCSLSINTLCLASTFIFANQKSSPKFIQPCSHGLNRWTPARLSKHITGFKAVNFHWFRF